MLKRPHYIALSLVVLLTLVFLSLPARTAARLKVGIGSLFLPLLGLANSSQHLTGKVIDQVIPRRELIAQNESLRRENQELRVKLMQAEAIERENARLRLLVGWQQQQGRKLKLARVVLRDASNWWRTVQIDLGQRDGITTNLTVISPEGYLVGRISSVVGPTRSQVVLLGDPNCSVAARVENETRDTGVIGSSRVLGSGIVDLGYLSGTGNLKPGQLVKSSGLGGVTQRDFPIGYVLDAVPIEAGFGTAARVKLAANLDSLDEVWVVML